VSAILAAVILAPCSAAAQETPQSLRQDIDQLRKDFETLKEQYGQRLSALEQKLAAAEGGIPPEPAATPSPAQPPAEPTAQVPAGAAGAGGPSGALPVYGASVGAGASKVFNPDMAVIGDFLGAAGHNPVSPLPAFEMHESEVSLQAVVDPYARADFFISFGEEGVNLEEGFMTFTELPGGLLTKVGKLRAAFGKVNTLHNHVLTWTDRPLVTRNLVGGEDGISDAGISVARLIPNPWFFLEATGQVFRGDSGTDESPLYHSNHPGDLSYVGHLRGYQDITEDSNLDLGFSYSTGHNGLPQDPSAVNSSTFMTSLYGIDATFRWRPLQRSIYHSFVGRTEYIWSRRDQPNGLQSGSGFYVSGDYQVGRRWFTGARYDHSARAYDATIVDKGGAVTITYWPSEFSQVRGQYRRTNYGTGENANEFLFQFQFSIGAHGAHPF
jgi:hypothetical protein